MNNNTQNLTDDNFRNALVNGIRAGEHFKLNMPIGIFDGNSGIKSGISVGNSLDFMEHRDYFSGDDLRQIDWNVYARTDKLTVKLFHQEVSPSIDIIIDSSASISASGNKKVNAVLSIAALLTQAALNSSYRIQVWRCSSNGFTLLDNAKSSPLLWGKFNFSETISPVELINKALPPFYSNGLRILISDLLFPDEPKLFASRFSLNSSASIIVQVLSENEINPEIHGNLTLTDSETNEERELHVNNEVLQRYKNRLNNHRQSWSDAARQFSILFTSITAESFIQKPIIEELIRNEVLQII